MSESLLRILWYKKSLIITLALNDVKIRYKNSVLGFIWSFLEPLLILSVLYFVFTHIIKAEIENYPLYLLLGLIFWYMFSRATTMGQSSLIDKAGILQKIKFQKEIFVISANITAVIMMALEFAAFAVFLIAFQFIPPITILILPIVIISLLLFSIGVSMILAITSVYFRDVKFIWQIILQAGFFLSPIIYKLETFPNEIVWILRINPIASILEIAHNATLYNIMPTTDMIMHVIMSTTIVLIIGSLLFKVKNKKIVEIL